MNPAVAAAYERISDRVAGTALPGSARGGADIALEIVREELDKVSVSVDDTLAPKTGETATITELAEMYGFDRVTIWRAIISDDFPKGARYRPFAGSPWRINLLAFHLYMTGKGKQVKTKVGKEVAP